MEQCRKCKEENKDCSNNSCQNCPSQQKNIDTDKENKNADKQYLTKGYFDGIL